MAITEPTGGGDFTDAAVPQSERMPRASLMMAWWAVCSAIFYLVVAAAMARTYGTAHALIGIGLSIVVYGVVNAVISDFARSTGLTVALFSRSLFGGLGSLIATLIFFATALYYAVFEGYVMALALTSYSGLAMPVSTLVVVTFGVALIGGGVQRWLDKFNGILLPVYVIGMLVAVAMAIAVHGYPDGWLTRQPAEGSVPFGWWHAFTYYMGIWVLMMFTFDYARFGRGADSRFHARITFGMPFYALAFGFSGVVGILLDAMLPSDGLSEASIVLGLLELMGVGGLALVWVTQSRINTANYYLATINLQVVLSRLFGKRIARWVPMALIVMLAWGLMSADVFGYLLTALAYQGVFVVAWVGVALASILSTAARRRLEADLRLGLDRLPALRLDGLAAWALATFCGVVVMQFDSVAIVSAPLTFLLAFGLTIATMGRGRSTGVAVCSPVKPF